MADTEARWYCVNAQGLPMLCASKEDAEREAARNDKVWPKGAPHRAVQLCDAAERDRLRADVRELVELVAETVNEWDSRIVDGNDYAACKRVIENTMAPLRALLAKHKEHPMNDQERAAFEAWARRARGFSDRYLAQQPDGYENEVVEASWVGWQAGRAALAAAPVTCQTYGPGVAVPCAECNQTLVDSQELAELRARVAAPQVPAAPQWRPIETAPTDTLVLLYGAKRSEMVVGMKHSRDGWVIDTPSEWAGMYPPTHWMPLPAAPGAPQPAEPAPQLQPLTADDIESLALDESLLLLCDDIEDLTEIVRAVEQMHGIRAADE